MTLFDQGEYQNQRARGATMRSMKFFILAACVLLLAPHALAQSCVLPDNGTGTVDLPPACPDGYQGDMTIVDGLPPGSTLEIEATLTDFLNMTTIPGGSLGGEIHQFDATLQWQLSGTGDFTGFSRQLWIPVSGVMHSGPRNPGDPVQTFAMDLVQLSGQLYGDPDFCELIVTAGMDFGLPSPGQTTLTRLPSGDFAVDSFFDITYQIQFMGCPGSILDGMAGTTTATDHFHAGEPYVTAVDDGSTPLPFALQQNIPNPFNPATTIFYDVPPSGGTVRLSIYDTRGRLVRELVNEFQSSGRKSVTWNGTDEGGRRVSSGVYLYLLDTRQGSLIRKMVMLK